MLKRKMLRDIIENKGNYLACSWIIIIGLMIFTALSTLSQTVHSAQSRFYAEQNFADGFAQVAAIPPTAVESLQKIEGVKEIQGRIVRDVLLYKPEIKTNIYLRLISLEQELDFPINAPMLHLGQPLKTDDFNIWIDNKFFAAHNLNLNDTLEIIINGKKQSLAITGVGSSPEFVYALPDASYIYPDPETFGIAFINLKALKKLLPEAGGFNELVFTLKPGADYELIEEQLKEKLQPYGLINIFPRSQQSSHFLLNMELTALTAVSKAIPIMFLLIAAMILYITLKRLIEQQRGQIGILKAEGYTEKEILIHYLSYAFIIGLFGGTLGIILGSLISFPLTALYQTFFNLPYLTGSFSFPLSVIGILLSLAFSLFAGYQGCKKVLSLEPAEAMRPPAPVQGKRIILERANLLWKSLSVQAKMAFRNLSRSGSRNLFIFLGIILCFAISGFTTSINDLFQRMVFDQYEKVEIYDLKMTLASPLEQKSVQRELESFPGIYQVEPLAEIPATLNNQWRQEDTVILGIESGSTLYNILDYQYNHIPLPQEGILLSQMLARQLQVSPGDHLTLDSPFKKNSEKIEVKVMDVIPQYIGANAYMELDALQNLLQQSKIATSFLINISPAEVESLQEKYLYSEQILSIDERTQRLDNVIELLSSFGYIIYYYVLVGVILGFVIIYSASSITIAERQRELASMLVLGMTPKEVLSVVTIEQWALALPAMLIGIPTAKIMMASIAQTLNNDLFSMPSQISTAALLSSFFVTGVSIWIAQKASAKKINKIKMTEVLANRE